MNIALPPQLNPVADTGLENTLILLGCAVAFIGIAAFTIPLWRRDRRRKLTSPRTYVPLMVAALLTPVGAGAGASIAYDSSISAAADAAIVEYIADEYGLSVRPGGIRKMRDGKTLMVRDDINRQYALRLSAGPEGETRVTDESGAPLVTELQQ